MKWTSTANLSANEIDETISYDETLGLTNLITNGNFEMGNTYNFPGWLSVQSTDVKFGNFALTQTGYGEWQSSEMIPVDTSKEYKMSVWGKTSSRSDLGSLAGGHIGFACYDKDYKFIDLRNCGGSGNTLLTRQANPGDTQIYIQSASGWVTGTDVTSTTYYFRNVLFYPPSHPDFSAPYEYTRIGYGDYSIYYTALTQVSANEWVMTLQNPLPDTGYSLPIGTPISRGIAGGTYNYAFGNPNLPETWTNYQVTIPAGVEIKNSDYRFRYATRYVRFLILGNYNIRTQSPNNATFLLDGLAFACSSEFQGNESNEVQKAIQGANGTFYAQEFNEIGTGNNNGQLGTLSKGGEFTVNGNIIEQ